MKIKSIRAVEIDVEPRPVTTPRSTSRVARLAMGSIRLRRPRHGGWSIASSPMNCGVAVSPES